MSSSGNSPHRFNGSVDSFYDPDFTADISKKMRVPERIVVDNNDFNGRSLNQFDDPAIIVAKKLANGNDGSKSAWMTVPERIVVVGNDSHMSGREPLPELKLENSMIGMSGDYNSGDNASVQLTTPPHTLTLNEHSFPTVGDTNRMNGSVSDQTVRGFGNKKKRNIALSGFANTSNNEDLILFENTGKESMESPEYQSFYNSNMSVNDMSDEAQVLRRQVKALSRRVAAIELDNQHRHQREVFVYTIGVIYFIIKGIFWIQKKI